MPPKPKYTEQEIAACAFEIAREEGLDAIAARSVAKRLGTTTSPIFTCFSGMDALKAAVLQGSISPAPAVEEKVKPIKAISARAFRLVGQPDAPQLAYRGSSKQIALSFERKVNEEFSNWLDQHIDEIAADIQQRWIKARQS